MLPLSAQTETRQDYLSLNVGDTLFGKVEHVDRRGGSTEYYKKIRFTDVKGKRKKYKRSDVESFQVSNVLYEGFWLSQSSEKIVLVNPRYDFDRENGERYFLRVMSRGRLSHYHLEWWEQGDAGINGMDMLLKEGDDYFIRATQGLFGLKKKVLSDYFQKCPDLVEKIGQKEIIDPSAVVDYFNANCADW
jgi:hypothetical protein